MCIDDKYGLISTKSLCYTNPRSWHGMPWIGTEGSAVHVRLMKMAVFHAYSGERTVHITFSYTPENAEPSH